MDWKTYKGQEQSGARDVQNNLDGIDMSFSIKDGELYVIREYYDGSDNVEFARVVNKFQFGSDDEAKKATEMFVELINENWR